jgi:hypothetical protein
VCSTSEDLAALDALIASVSVRDAPASADDGKACAAGSGKACEKQQRLATASVAAGVCSFSAVGVPKQQSWGAAKQQCGQDDAAGGAQQRATGVVAQQLNPFAPDDELQISPAIFAALQDELVTPCNVDACASENGDNALLPDYCCAGSKSFFDRNFEQGDFLWLHTPRRHRELFLTRYRLHM